MIARTRSALLACAVLVATTSCSLFGSNEHYRPDTDIQLASVEAHVPAGQVRWTGFIIGGEAGEYRVARDAGELRIQSEQIAWDQHLVGPILPVLPVLMGVSPTLIGIEVRVTASDAPQTLIPANILLRETKHYDGSAPSEETFAPGACERIFPDAPRSTRPVLVLKEPILLAPGEALRLCYAPSVRSVEGFDLLLPSEREEQPALRLPFLYRSSSFIGWFLPLPSDA